jgi:uncharacterized delta-60 repeat protein
MTVPRPLRYTLVALATALVMAVAATAAPRDLDRSFGGDGIVLTPVGAGSAQGRAIARQRDGKIVAAGDGQVANTTCCPGAVALARYNPNGTLDRTFGGGDGTVVEQFHEEGTGGRVVAIQPDGKILVAGQLGCCTARLYVARYLPDGSRDPSFGTAGVAKDTPHVCCDGSLPTGLAVDRAGRIFVSGWIHNTFTADSFVARLTSDGHPDPAYAGDGMATLHLGDADEKASFAYGLVIQRGKAVIAGQVLRAGGHTDLMLARLDEDGGLDETFDDDGVVEDRADDDDFYEATDVALWNGKLLVSGFRSATSAPDFDATRNYLLARFNAGDGSIDTSFNPGGSNPGHVFAGAGDGNSRADALAVNQATGAATLVGSADKDGERRMMIVRYTSDGLRDDAGFHSSDGHVGARLLDVGNGGRTVGEDVLLDGVGKVVAAGTALDAGRDKFVLARLGDTPPKPNLRPVPRIRGHHIVPRKHWVRFDASRSFDRDGRIVDYAWRTGDRPFRSLGPVFWHRFGRAGAHVLSLRVRDNRGATAVATFRVSVRKRGGP